MQKELFDLSAKHEQKVEEVEETVKRHGRRHE